MRFRRVACPRFFAVLVLAAFWLGASPGWCQTPPVPATSPVPHPPESASLEERLQQLEQMNRKLLDQLDASEKRHDRAIHELRQQLDAVRQSGSSPVDIESTTLGEMAAPESPPVPAGNANPPVAPATRGAGTNAGAGEEILGGSASTAPAAAQPSSRFNMPAAVPDLRAQARFGPGFEVRTPDDEYSFQFHNLTQVDYRGYLQSAHSDPTTTRFDSTFGIPREWSIFGGRLTKPFEYYVVPSFGFDNVNLLDAFLNVRFDDRFQLKIGRYKTPFTYEYYNGPINGLIIPERSLFFNNYGLNREIGIMLWGQWFQKRIDYAVGIFNNNRNGYVSRDSQEDIAALVNFRPFATWLDTPLENLNFGGSIDAGNEFGLPIPPTLRTNVPTTGNGFFGVPFLAFNPNVIESGYRVLWDLHAAYYYRHLSLIAEWASGFSDYAFTSQPQQRTHLPVGSYFVQAGYFLTGETVANRGTLKPLRNFDLRPGKFGLGAIELGARISTLDIGQEIFTHGLANPDLWTNNLYTIDVGVNWYWTQYIKCYLGWQHAVFGQPVLLDPGRYQLTSDLLWTRFQISF